MRKTIFLLTVCFFLFALGQLNVHDLQDQGWGVSISYLGSMKVDTRVTQYQSQVRQDIIVDLLLRNKTNGFFVDLASNDAIKISNTVFLESVRNWKGICIEVNPAYEVGLLSRKCTYVKAVVGPETGSKVQFTFQGSCGPACGGIVSSETDNKLNKAKHAFTFQTVTVEKILNDLHAPPVIDYMSLDIEGMEYLTFKEFNFAKYKFRVLTVERPKMLSEVLKLQGYRHLGGLGGFGETVWVHEDFLDDLNLVSLRDFKYFKPLPQYA
eukprot:TRINITY_DN111_c0_g1_i16.p1 TRINITY_DN111_c0_g1~~TRINITY_DN111_c0_g1_i16.p1  ORF type:complete len:267 (+),score=27.08 TRINITY_DN111_c0_g1_i16:164-964(+)